MGTRLILIVTLVVAFGRSHWQVIATRSLITAAGRFCLADHRL